MREIRKPDTTTQWAGWGLVALVARVGWVFIADHLGGAAGTVLPPPATTPPPKPATHFTDPLPTRQVGHHKHRGETMTKSKFTLATCNDDWASAGSNIDDVKSCDVVFIQEGKRAHYRKLLGPGYVVRQSWLSKARAGSVIVIRKDSGLKLGGYGWTFGVDAVGLLPRWIAWQRAKATDVPLLLMCAQRPPLRTAAWWNPFDIAFSARVRAALRAHREVLAGLDANQRDPSDLTRRTGLTWHTTNTTAKHLDGFLVSRGVKVSGITALPYDTSDHQPLVATVEIVGRV